MISFKCKPIKGKSAKAENRVSGCLVIEMRVGSDYSGHRDLSGVM